MRQTKKALGAISALGTFALIGLYAYRSEAFGPAVRELLLLLSGNVREIPTGDANLFAALSVIAAIIVLELPCAMAAIMLQGMILGKSGRHSVAELFQTMREGNHFFSFFAFVLIEEIFARWLFLGLLPRVSFLSGAIAFYILFLAGNGVWALVHILNFKEEKDRNILRVLPQFISGIFFTYVFVKYGLLAVILTHFASNAILFALDKIQRVSVIDGLIVLYAALSAAGSWYLMERPVSEALAWFTDNPTFALDGWQFWDYVKLAVFISSCFVILFGCLLYDRGEARGGKPHPVSDRPGFVHYAVVVPIIVVLVVPVVIGLLWGLYGLLGYVIESVPYRVLAAAILWTFLSKGASGSAVARIFWQGLPSTYITICILQALPFWSAAGYALITTLIWAPQIVLTVLDD